MKLKTTPAMALCALALLAAQPVLAAPKKGPSAVVKVLGSIVPQSCAIQVGNNGELDYGEISAEYILADPTIGKPIGYKDTTLTIDCGEVSSQVGVSLADNRAESRVDGLTMIPAGGISITTSGPDAFGLGTANGKNLGAYVAGLREGTVGSADSYFGYVDMNDISKLTSISNVVALNADDFSKNRLATWIDPDTKQIAAGKVFNAMLAVSPTLNKGSELDLSGNVRLDGNATLTVYYL